MIKNYQNRKLREKYKAIIDEARNKPCIDCGIQLPKECMEFDHIKGKKLFDVGSAYCAGVGKKKILDEIAKCDIRCPNCHKLRHYKDNYKTGAYKSKEIEEIKPQWQKVLGFD